MREQLQVMQRQMDWFKKQLFGPKSEKQVVDLPGQDSLFQSSEAPIPEKPPEDENRTVRAFSEALARSSGTMTA
ncbi:MAG: hypothetical protein R6W86_07935 [Marinobacter sp.]|uniref:IS66 family transposase n=1 Tax=Marinobacter sp. TaxID=50741 RepID=UPI00396E410B